jgi:hypothetical protein
MMDLRIICLSLSLFLVGCSTTRQAVMTFDDIASKETEQYISDVDRLIERDESKTDTFRIVEYHNSIVGKNAYGGIWEYVKQDINAGPFDGGEKILYEEAFGWEYHIKEYYRDEKRVAVIVAKVKISSEIDSETRQVTVYMNDNEVVYCQTNGRNIGNLKRILKQRYGLKIHPRLLQITSGIGRV